MLGLLVVLLNLAAFVAYALAARQWFRAARPVSEALDADAARLGLCGQSRALARGAALAAGGVAAEGLSLLLMLLIATVS
jgi:hypothetical protein